MKKRVIKLKKGVVVSDDDGDNEEIISDKDYLNGRW